MRERQLDRRKLVAFLRRLDVVLQGFVSPGWGAVADMIELGRFDRCARAAKAHRKARVT